MLFFFFFSSFQCFNLFSCIPLFFFLVCMCVCQELSQESLSIEKEREGNWGEELLVAVFFFFASGWLGRCDAELTWHFAFYCCSLLYLFFFFLLLLAFAQASLSIIIIIIIIIIFIIIITRTHKYERCVPAASFTGSTRYGAATFSSPRSLFPSVT